MIWKLSGDSSTARGKEWKWTASSSRQQRLVRLGKQIRFTAFTAVLNYDKLAVVHYKLTHFRCLTAVDYLFSSAFVDEIDRKIFRYKIYPAVAALVAYKQDTVSLPKISIDKTKPALLAMNIWQLSARIRWSRASGILTDASFYRANRVFLGHQFSCKVIIRSVFY